MERTESNAAMAPAIAPELVFAIERATGHRFANRSYLRNALSHSSFANENGCDSNERLEFLGDAVLELCVSDELFRRFPHAREGELTSLRSSLVNSATLAQKARSIGLADALLLGKGEECQGGRQKQSVLEDVFEAFLGAVYLDAGFESARKALYTIFKDIWPCNMNIAPKKDAKTRLQEISLQCLGGLPVYRRVGSSGPEHAKVFRISLLLPDGREFLASGSSNRKAEHAAAGIALSELLKS